MENINGIHGLNPLQQEGAKPKNPIKDIKGADFDETLQGFLKDVNELQLNADESIQKMVAGEVKDVHQVMLAVGEAKVAFNMMLEIRNKTMEAYQELMRMRG
jgi:flagellar hook-basal body complex protein FliE